MQIERRLAGGAGVRMLAREFAIDPAAISRRFPQQSQQLRAIAQRLAEVQSDVAGLPVQQQHLVLRLADELRQITGDLTGAARAGSATARELAERAHRQVQNMPLTETSMETSMETLAGAGALIRLSTEAAHIGLRVLKIFESPAREAEAARKAEETKVTHIEIVPMQAQPSAAQATNT